METNSRDEAINQIRASLKQRSGKSWSVTGGRGTAWGWIEINVPPSKRDQYGAMSAEAQQELQRLLGLDRVHDQGVSIPASSEYRTEFMARANGDEPSVYGKQYWD